ncbi:hypothetical protein NL676_006975 [Syzygium grande]|nr:hypothetical protein NL676_006975 [Syzygium grande]
MDADAMHCYRAVSLENANYCQLRYKTPLARSLTFRFMLHSLVFLNRQQIQFEQMGFVYERKPADAALVRVHGTNLVLLGRAGLDEIGDACEPDVQLYQRYLKIFPTSFSAFDAFSPENTSPVELFPRPRP